MPTPPTTPPAFPPPPGPVPVQPATPSVPETVQVSNLSHEQAVEIIRVLPADDNVPEIIYPTDLVQTFKKNALDGSTGMKSTGLVVSKYEKSLGWYALVMNYATFVLIAAFWMMFFYGVGKQFGFLHQENVFIPLVLLGTVSVFLLIIDKCWVNAEALEVYLFEDLSGNIIPFSRGFKLKPWWWKPYSEKPKETLKSDREWSGKDVNMRSKDNLTFELEWTVFNKILMQYLHSVLMFSDQNAEDRIMAEYKKRFMLISGLNSAETIMTHMDKLVNWVNLIVGDEDEVTLFEQKFGRSLSAVITNLDLVGESKKSYEALVNARILGRIIRGLRKDSPDSSADEILRMAMRTMNAQGFSTETVSIMGQGANNIRSLVLRGDDDHHVT